MNTNLIRLFLCETKGKQVDYAKVADRAVRAGYIVEPEAATVDVMKFLDEQTINPNATFYKQWEDILSRTRLELAIDQIRHYASTYGSIEPEKAVGAVLVAGKESLNVEYNCEGNGWIPNDNPIVMPFKQFKVIKAVTEDEVKEKILDLFRSGAALKSDTINVCVDFLKTNGFLKSLNTDEIKNKEAQATIACMTKCYPTDEFGLLRCIVYTFTGKTTLIKDRASIHTIEGKNGFTPKDKFDFAILSDKQLTNLSRIFYRYKPLFLAMKGYYDNAKYINKLRRLATKNHTPLKKGFWEDCFNTSKKDTIQLLNEAKANVGSLNNFRKVQLMQSIMERLNGRNMDGKMYIIRNGKMFIREGYQPKTNMVYLMDLYNVIKTSLVESLKAKATTIMLPKGLHLTCPTSEKNFIGNYPVGSSVDFSDSDNVIGIYWRNEWGTRDFDLHVITEDGKQYGWNEAFRSRDQDIIYSGDMTNANPEAAELFYFKAGMPDGYINVNKYNGEDKSKLRLFVAKENMVDKLAKAYCQNDPRSCPRYSSRKLKEYMVDPNNIVAEAMMDMNDTSQKTLAYIHDNRLYLLALQSGNGRVSTRTNQDIIQQANKVKMDSFIDLLPILEEAGFKVVYEGHTEAVQEAKEEVTKVDVTGLSVEEAVAKVKAEYDKTEVENAKKDETVEVGIDLTNPTPDVLLKLFA